jgi:hypothetical protein
VKSILGAVLVIGALEGNACAATTFDGAWSVMVTTAGGSCEPTTQLNVDIRNGALVYSGESAMAIHGDVMSSGRVRVHFTNGSRSANGFGQLVAASGSGTWQGHGAASSCTGRWSAVKR